MVKKEVELTNFHKTAVKMSNKIYWFNPRMKIFLGE